MNKATKRWIQGAVFALGATIFAGTASAEGGAGEDELLCKDARVVERMFEDICWSCILPIRIGGAGTPMPDNAPSGANDSFLCMCNPPIPGINVGAWFPVRLAEMVKTPGCSPALFGEQLGVGSRTEMGGYRTDASKTGQDGGTFRHMHWFAFPAGEMLGLIAGCNPADSFDLLQLTELIPTWNNDMLAFITNPETAIFANPISVQACIAEATYTGAGGREPLESLFWCAGSWGTLYPITGNVTNDDSNPGDSSLMAARQLLQLHRWGLARKTMGNSCGGDIHPHIPKNQYRFSQYWPVPESNNFHWIGESDFRWGVHRNRIGQEDYLQLIYRWNDCCFEPL